LRHPGQLTGRIVAICGTWYAGEIKKSVFTILIYSLPKRTSAHARLGQYRPKGDVAIFLA